MMRENFDMLHGSSYFIRNLAKFFLYTYILLFICGILNIFLTIMEDAYSTLMDKLKKRGGEEMAIQKEMAEDTADQLDSSANPLKASLLEGDTVGDMMDMRIDTRMHLIDLLCDSIVQKLNTSDTRVTEQMIEELRQSAKNVLLSTLGDE
jgi:hypothetical protein